jgi:hypothetical protein
MPPSELINSTLSDLIIEECIPNCEECAGIWINELIGHRIVCVCNKCEKHKERANELIYLQKQRLEEEAGKPSHYLNQPSESQRGNHSRSYYDYNT